jgi:hypothetical protein
VTVEAERLNELVEKVALQSSRQAVTRVLTDLASIAEQAAADPKLAFVSGPIALAGFAKTIREMIPGFEEPKET